MQEQVYKIHESLERPGLPQSEHAVAAAPAGQRIGAVLAEQHDRQLARDGSLLDDLDEVAGL